MKLVLRGLSFRATPRAPRFARAVFGVALFVAVCLVVAHGCHFGGHDVDVEP